jgi:hypothetical protein
MYIPMYKCIHELVLYVRYILTDFGNIPIIAQCLHFRFLRSPIGCRLTFGCGLKITVVAQTLVSICICRTKVN